MLEVLSVLYKSQCENQTTVLTVVLEAEGSAPQVTGAAMLTGPNGRIAGTVGGGALEHRAIQDAKGVLQTGESTAKFFSLSKSGAGELGMVCGGNIRLLHIYLEPDGYIKTIAEKCLEYKNSNSTGWLFFEYDTAGGKDVAVKLFNKKAAEESGEDTGLFMKKAVYTDVDGIYKIAVPLTEYGKAVVFGGGHLAQALVPILVSLDFNTVVFDDRQEFAMPEMFPGARQVICGDFAKFQDYVELKPSDFAIVVTRGHLADYTVVEQLMHIETAYTGVVGSRTKTKLINQKLIEAGVPQSAIDFVHTPIGLPIKAVTPAEIAVSIAAELVLVRAGGEGREYIIK